MDVRITGNDYVPAPPPPPMPTGGSTAPAPEFVMPTPSNVEDQTFPRSPDVRDALGRAVNDINQTLDTHSRHLDIRIHEATNRPVVTVVNTNTDEVVRVIPSEDVLDAHANMLEMAGIFVNARG